jgi:hypothetical protein
MVGNMKRRLTREPKLSVISHTDSLVLILKDRGDDDGTENFLAVDLCVLRWFDEDGGRHETPFLPVPGTSNEQLGIGLCALYIAKDPFELLPVYEWTELCLRLHLVGKGTSRAFKGTLQRFEESVGDGFVEEKPGRRCQLVSQTSLSCFDICVLTEANLPRIKQKPLRKLRNRILQIRVFEHNGGTLAAQLKRHLLQVALRGRFLHFAARRRRTSERDLVDVHVAREESACAAVPADNIHDAGRETSFFEERGEGEHSQGRFLARLKYELGVLLGRGLRYRIW